MPITAPTLDQQVAPGELPGVRLPTTTAQEFGGGIAQGLGAVGDAMKDIAFRQKANSDEVVSQDAATQFAKVTLDQTERVRSTRGRAAGEAMASATTEIQKERDRIAGTLTDQNQRLQFQKMADQHQLFAGHHMGLHVAEQADVADQQSTRDTVELAQQTAANNAHDPTSVKLQHQTIIDTLDAAGKRQGWDAPTLEANRLQALSGMHVNVVTQMLTDGQGAEAKAYLAEHGTEMLAEHRDALSKQTEHIDLLGQAQQASDRIVAGAKGDLGVALADVQKIADPHLREKAQELVEHAIDNQRRVLAASQKSAFDRAATIVQDPKGPGFFAPAVQMERENMSPEHWQVLEGMAKRDTPQADPIAVYRFMKNLADPATRDDYARRDLTKEFDPRSPQFKEMAAAQNEVIKGGGPKTDSFLTREQAVKRAYALAGIKDDNSPNAIALSDALEKRVKANETAGKKMSGDDINELAKQMLVEDVVYKKGTIYGLNPVRADQITPEDLRETTLPDAKLRAVNSAMADQFNARIRERASRLGLTPEHIDPTAFDAARALNLIARDEEAAGRAGQDKHRKALAGIDDVLRAGHVAPPKPYVPRPGETASQARARQLYDYLADR